MNIADTFLAQHRQLFIAFFNLFHWSARCLQGSVMERRAENPLRYFWLYFSGDCMALLRHLELRSARLLWLKAFAGGAVVLVMLPLLKPDLLTTIHFWLGAQATDDIESVMVDRAVRPAVTCLVLAHACVSQLVQLLAGQAGCPCLV